MEFYDDEWIDMILIKSIDGLIVIVIGIGKLNLIWY